MQKFGIEIRKAGTRSGLYADVDKVLSEIGIGNGGVSKVMQVQTVAHSLQNMLKSERHFDVCTIRNCASICNLCIPVERMDIYRAAHCMNWSEMLPEYRMALTAMVLDDFRTILT